MELTREVFDKLRTEFTREVHSQIGDEEYEDRAVASLDVAILRTILGDSAPQPKPKTRGGRPRGSKNKPKDGTDAVEGDL